MIFSEKMKTIFVHIPKTGGTSIQSALLSIDDLPKDLKVRTKHETLEQFCGRTNIDVSGYTILAVTRHPCERFTSFFHYLVKFKASGGKDIVKLGTADQLVKSLQAKDAALMRTHSIKPQTDFLTFKGKMPDSLRFDILRFENLEDEFNAFQKRLGLNARLPKLNVSRKHNYKSELSDDSLAFLREFYREDFETFGYEL